MSIPLPVIQAYGLSDQPITRIQQGLINQTWFVGQHLVIQSLHPVFDATVNDDIAVLTPTLSAAGVSVPSLVQTRAGQRYVVDQGTVWRALTRLPGRSLDRIESPEQARSAAALVARFHNALLNVRHDFAFSRPQAHDTRRHLANLHAALARHPTHRHTSAIAALSHELTATLKPLLHRTKAKKIQRLCHGDLKISNLLFEGDQATAIIDLDTMAWMSLDSEMGDALRSWCNQAGEDAEAKLDLTIFAAAIEGYLGGNSWIAPSERGELVDGFERICLELSTRFAADALEESYFGWNETQYDNRGDHNLVRARGQWHLAQQVQSHRSTLEAIVAEHA